MPATKTLSFNSSIVLERLVTRITGTCCIAPVEALATVCVKATERLLGMITPSTPEASAVLNMNPDYADLLKPSKIITVEKPSLSF